MAGFGAQWHIEYLRTASCGPAIFRCLLLAASLGLPSRPLSILHATPCARSPPRSFPSRDLCDFQILLLCPVFPSQRQRPICSCPTLTEGL